MYGNVWHLVSGCIFCETMCVGRGGVSFPGNRLGTLLRGWKESYCGWPRGHFDTYTNSQVMNADRA